MQLNRVQALHRSLFRLEKVISISSSAYVGATIKAHTNGLKVGGRYRYTGHLLALETCKPEEVTSVTGADIVTPLQVEVWEAGLAAHPDRQFAEYILQGLRQGFRIGFDRAKTHLQHGNTT